jgi:DNA-binding MarR family transcriptional regulator
MLMNDSSVNDPTLNDSTGQPAADEDVPSLAAELRVALLRAARRLRAERADEDVSSGQYSVLAYLDRHGPATPGAIAEFERVRPPSLSRTLAALEALGFTERTGHPDDGRQVLVRLTEAGSGVVLATRSRRDAWLSLRVADLDPADRAVLAAATEILRRIADS